MTCRLNIIIKNTFKDLRLFYRQIFLFLFGTVLFASFMATSTSDQSWRLYILNGSGLISCAVMFYLHFDKQHRNDVLTFSLPVSRMEILLSKYLTSWVIVLSGCFIYYISAAVLNLKFRFDDYYLFQNIYMGILILCYNLIFINAVLAAHSAFENIFFLIITGVTIMVMYILFVEKILLKDGLSEPSLSAILILSTIIVLVTAVSFRYTQHYFSYKEI
ncbi:MAG: ABC-2 transporter permease [Candidatus Cloacimonetes bacterium]|nr:ABC-2 transporter permease [Candidatus Cloacimonadota bacterium]